MNNRHFCFQVTYIVAIAILFCISCTPKEPWTPLFNGNDLANFTVRNGEAEFSIADGCIVGTSKAGTPNTFLCTNENYGDFILEFEVWADTSLNSGVQFRSQSLPEYNDGQVHGYQVEIESSSRKWAGGIYDEGRRGWLYPLKDHHSAQRAFNPNQWNGYRVEAFGSSIRTWVNMVQCTHLIDDATDSGFIGLQVHGIGDNITLAGKQIKWRNLRIITEDVESHLWPSRKYVPIIDVSIKSE